MAIKIIRNEEANCITFRGTSVPAYFNACLSGVVSTDDPDLVNIRNDIRSQDQPEDFFEFSNIHYTEFEDKDGNPFASALEVANYVTEQGNVLGLNDAGEDLTGITVNFKLDQTSTSIVLDNGYSFGVNTIKAVAQGGTISINSIGEGVPNEADAPSTRVHFEKLDHTSVTVNGSAVSGGLNDVINTLNELFTVGAFEAVVISDPYSTMVADVSGVDTTNPTYVGNSIDPIGNDIWGTTSSNSQNGFLTTETINQAGEYFTFDIRNMGTIGFGLVHTQDSFDDGYYSGNVNYANPANFGVLNSAHYGFQFSHWFHQTPKGSWTNYGANTSYSIRPGWSNWDQKQDWIDGNPVKIKVGIDENGYISIESLQNDGNWVVHVRTSYPIEEGAEFRLGIKANSTAVRLYTNPKVHLLEEAAPTMYFRYIESPDGVYQYPLFATQEEAEYYDLNHEGTTGTGTSHTPVFVDDPTGTTWYMPDTGRIMNGVTPPQDFLHTVFMGNTVTYTEITSLTDADLVPPTFSAYDLTVDELSSVNYQTQPMDTAYTTTINNLPIPLVHLGGGIISGTAPEVTGDNVSNPSDTYNIEVIRTNSYGSSTGNFNIIVNNLTVPVTVPSGFTLTSGSMADANTLDNNSVVTLDDTLASGKRMIVSKSWIETNVLPNITGALEKAYIGVPSTSANWSNNADLHIDFDAVMRWEGQSSNAHKSTLADGSDIVARSENSVGSATNAYYNYAIQWDGTDLIVMADVDVSKLNNTFDYTQMQRYSVYENYTEQSGSLPLVFATKSGGQMGVTMTGITFVDIPAEPVTNLTNWNKAIDFSGSNEHAAQVGGGWYASPLKMGNLGTQVSANSDLTKTSNSSSCRAWATAIVFKSDRHNSNQHIWNAGEGANSGHDNIFLRQSANGQLFFGWGREGTGYNEVYITTVYSNNWYGVYIAHKGQRFSNSNATAANLSDAFDIRVMTSESGDNFNTVYSLGNLPGNWTNTGVRMDRQFTGSLTIGGRGNNRSFHGKVASMVVANLKINQTMPNDTEIKMMITDPKKWEDNYRDGQQVRQSIGANNATYMPSNLYNGYGTTQIWLMGDGTNDNYSNMIRNQVYPTEQNYTKLQLNSMVSGDIQNVTIPGLT